MIAVIQRVSRANVKIDSKIHSEIDKLKSFGKKNIPSSVAYVIKSLIDNSSINHGN